MTVTPVRTFTAARLVAAVANADTNAPAYALTFAQIHGFSEALDADTLATVAERYLARV